MTREPQTPLAALLLAADSDGLDWLSPEQRTVILQPELDEVLGDEPTIDKWMAMRRAENLTKGGKEEC